MGKDTDLVVMHDTDGLFSVPVDSGAHSRSGCARMSRDQYKTLSRAQQSALLDLYLPSNVQLMLLS
jgi:hypothetical protein